MTATFNETDFLEFSRQISGEVFTFVKQYYLNKLLAGISQIEYTDAQSDNVKQEHKIDKLVKELILARVDADYPFLKAVANFCIEDYKQINNTNAGCTIMIDPVDGSRCADQKIGDPCLMLGISFTDFGRMTFKDLKCCFIKALHSGDCYFVYQDRAFYIPDNLPFIVQNGAIFITKPGNAELVEVKPLKHLGREHQTLGQAAVIIRDGYGMREIVKDKLDHDVLNRVKHSFAHDITGIELCFLTRDIVQLVAEARKHYQEGQWIGSDGFNLIPYPLVKAVGGMIYDLQGRELEEVKYNPYEIYDFIAAAAPGLLQQFVEYGVRKENFGTR